LAEFREKFQCEGSVENLGLVPDDFDVLSQPFESDFVLLVLDLILKALKTAFLAEMIEHLNVMIVS
jgi:hypothetical protein